MTDLDVVYKTSQILAALLGFALPVVAWAQYRLSRQHKQHIAGRHRERMIQKRWDRVESYMRFACLNLRQFVSSGGSRGYIVLKGGNICKKPFLMEWTTSERTRDGTFSLKVRVLSTNDNVFPRRFFSRPDWWQYEVVAVMHGNEIGPVGQNFNVAKGLPMTLEKMGGEDCHSFTSTLAYLAHASETEIRAMEVAAQEADK